jgi:DNA-binding CsgD family transcriptional regulator
MQQLKNPGTDETVTGTRDGETTLFQVFRSMVAMIGTHTDDISTFPANGVSEHVIFDVDVNGDRYILLKMIQMDRSTLSLSPRELEIVRMVARGHPNKVIAGFLNISTWTVCTHLRRVFAKLEVTSRAAMVAKVADLTGVIEPKAHDAPFCASPRCESTGPAAAMEPTYAMAEATPRRPGYASRVAKNGCTSRVTRSGRTAIRD